MDGSKEQNTGFLGTPDQEAGRVAKATGLMAGLTVLSRLLGLARDIAQAAILGTSMAADAFTLAFIIPNTLRRVFGEATVSSAFVPTYTETLLVDHKRESDILASKIITFVAVILLACVAIGIFFAPLLIKLFAPGFSLIEGKAELTSDLLRILFPYIFFVGIASVLMGVLNSYRHFFTPALAPVLFNVSALIGLFFIAKYIYPAEPVLGYAIGVTIGGVLQLLIQIPAMKSNGIVFKPDFNWRNNPRLKAIGKLAIPALIGLMAAEVNMIVDKMIASLLDPGSVSALAYGNRIMLFPLGVFAVSLATALLPTLSRQTAAGELEDAKLSLSRASLTISAFIIPVTFCMMFLSEPIVRVIFGRGVFSARSIELTSAALAFYSAGLLFYSAIKITVPVFYAMKDTKTPVRIAVGCMGLNILLNISLTYFFMKTQYTEPLAGLALATTLSAFVNIVLLRIALKRKIRTSKGYGVGKRAWLSLLPSSVAVLFLLWRLTPYINDCSKMGLIPGVLSLLGICFFSLIIFLLIFAVIGGPDARHFFKLIVSHVKRT